MPQRVREPAAALRLQKWQDRVEVHLVALSVRMLRLEQERDLGPEERNPVVGALDYLVVRQADRLVPTADPRVAVRRLAEDVETPEPGLRLARPGLMRVVQPVACLVERRRLLRPGDHTKLELREHRDDLAHARVRNRDLEVHVLAMATAEEEVDRPARGDVPRDGDLVEPACDLLRAPRVPELRVGDEASRWTTRSWPRPKQWRTSCGDCGRRASLAACASSSVPAARRP